MASIKHPIDTTGKTLQTNSVHTHDKLCPFLFHHEVVLGGSEIQPFTLTICSEQECISTCCTTAPAWQTILLPPLTSELKTSGIGPPNQCLLQANQDSKTGHTTRPKASGAPTTVVTGYAAGSMKMAVTKVSRSGPMAWMGVLHLHLNRHVRGALHTPTTQPAGFFTCPGQRDLAPSQSA